ncbi:sensor histidine kinase [Streptomyces ovatisporus]|uniref:histidine kinase n=1 Tax=Streptomyces ovatisporus TaxID=1128682 RepID=A0ABV9A6M9_9ACTN
MPAYKPRTLAVVAVLAAAVLAVVWVLFVKQGVESSSPRQEAAGWLLTVAGCGALYWRHRRPVAVGVFVLLCNGVYFPISNEDVPLLVLAFAVALYTVAADGHLIAAATIALVTLVSVAYGELGLSRGERHVDDAAMFLLVGWFVGLVAAGYAQRTRQAYLREAEQRALAAEREKDVRAMQSAAEERLRIARELHDVLGHSISLINVQAGAALHRHAKDSSRTDELLRAMESVRDASREALRELRATLGVLRQVDEPAPTVPAAVGTGEIEALGERARRAGLDVRVEVDVRAQLPPQVSLAAYRIVQESLTNVVRHAHARSARVQVRDEAGGEGDEGGTVLRVRVEDDGRGAPRGARGSGISGMEERARALGGWLTVGNAAGAAAGRGADGGAGGGAGGGAVHGHAGEGTGWVVEARLPLREPGEGTP